MGGLGVGELSLILLIISVFAIPYIFFILTLRKAVLRCEVESREISPGSIWLLLLPLFNLIWQFYVVTKLSMTLGKELNRKGIESPANPAQSIGIAMCIFQVLTLIPIVGAISGIVGFVLWIVYWVKIANFSSQLVVIKT